jgi:hypothetical protein
VAKKRQVKEMQQIGVIKQNEFLVKKQLAARYDQTLKAQSF